MRRDSKASWLILATCIALFCLAMGLRDHLNIWIGTTAAALTSVALLWFGARPQSRAPGSTPTGLAIALGAFAGVLMSFATWWLYPVSVSLLPPIQGEVEALYSLLRQAPGPLRAFPLMLLVVVAEELVWRGLAIDLLSKPLGAGRAVLVSAFLYILPQIALGSPLLIVIAASCGLLWGALRVTTHGLLAPLFAHLVWDFLVFVIYPVA